jgi:hypothetical protein
MPRDPRVTDDIHNKLKAKAARVMAPFTRPDDLDLIATRYANVLSCDYDVASWWLAYGGSETVN